MDDGFDILGILDPSVVSDMPSLLNDNSIEGNRSAQKERIQARQVQTFAGHPAHSHQNEDRIFGSQDLQPFA